jgi:hypothetical protein
MQYPVEVPGVSVLNFLRSSMNAVRGEEISPRDFIKRFQEKSRLLEFDPARSQTWPDVVFGLKLTEATLAAGSNSRAPWVRPFPVLVGAR